MDRALRTRLATALVLTLVFGSGVLVGFATDSNLGAASEAVAGAEESEEGGEEAVEERRRRTPIYARVDPTEEQRAEIDSIVREHRQRMNALDGEFREEYNPRYDAIIHDTRMAIKAVFTPSQAAEYQALLDDFDRNRAEERSNRNNRR